jgi:hypothetical protein
MSSPPPTGIDPGPTNPVGGSDVAGNGSTPGQGPDGPAIPWRPHKPLKRPDLWPEPWAGEAYAQQAHVEARMRVAYQTQTQIADNHNETQISDQQRQAVASAIDSLLGSVREAVKREEIPRRHWSVKSNQGAGVGEDGSADSNKSNKNGRQSPRLRKRRRRADRRQGTSVEWAYSHLHAAKTVLVDLLSIEEVDTLIPSATARIATCLDANDIRRLNLDHLHNESSEARRRAGLKHALEIGYDASDQLHTRARGFRNMLYTAAAVISILMLLIMLAVAFFPWALPLCFEPTVPAPAATRSESGTDPYAFRQVCPSGQDKKENGMNKLHEPSAGDVIIVAGLGLLGGALAGAFALRKVSGTSTPYDIPLALAVLKLPIGALTAVTGILLLGGGFVPGFSELDSQRQILAYALLFGYAQQLATQFIDKHAKTILQSIPAKDETSKRPTQPSQNVRQSSSNESRSVSSEVTTYYRHDERAPLA